MARVAITVTDVDHDGVPWPTPQPNEANDEMEIEDNDGQVILIFENTGTVDVTVTVKAAATYGTPPIPLTDRTYLVEGGDTLVAGGFAGRLFNQAGDQSTRSVLVNFTGTDGMLNVIALRVPISGT